MNGNWILKIYPKQNQELFVRRNICKKRNTKIKSNYYICNYIKKPKKEIRKLQKADISYSCYKVEYERANNYRQVFFARTEGPYRCRYCNKKLTKQNLYVDHIIPVNKSQTTRSAKILLHLKRCNSVNDIKNLAPACKYCNLRKSNKMGIWVVRGWLGKYKLYWAFLWMIKIIGASVFVLSLMWLIRFIILI